MARYKVVGAKVMSNGYKTEDPFRQEVIDLEYQHKEAQYVNRFAGLVGELVAWDEGDTHPILLRFEGGQTCRFAVAEVEEVVEV